MDGTLDSRIANRGCSVIFGLTFELKNVSLNWGYRAIGTLSSWRFFAKDDSIVPVTF